MNPPITIQTKIIGTEETNAVNARELHEALEIQKDFSDWIKAQIKSLGLEANVDYVTTPLKRGIANGGYKIVNEYILTLDAAKHIAMASRSAKGKEVRAYFIEVEKRWRGGMVAGQNLSAVVEMVAENLARLGEVVATLSAQMERLDRRLQIYEAAEAYRRERARRRALRKPTTNALVAQAYEGRRAQFMTLVHGVLMQAKGELSQGELLRRSGYRRDDKTARRWLQEGIGVYWEVRAKGRSLCYRLIKAQEAA